MSSSSLVAEPSFLEGMGRIVDWGSALNQYNWSPSGEKADRRALQGDWQVLMQDFAAALRLFVTTLTPEECNALVHAIDDRERTTGITEETRMARALFTDAAPTGAT